MRILIQRSRGITDVLLFFIKFFLDSNASTALKPTHSLRVKLSDCAIGLVIRIGVLISEFPQWYPLDFNVMPPTLHGFLGVSIQARK